MGLAEGFRDRVPQLRGVHAVSAQLVAIALAVLLEGPLTPAPMPATGIASQYAPGVMQRVIANRQRWEQIPRDLRQYNGFVAVPYPANIGDEYWIRPAGTEDWELFLAVDCGGIADGGRRWMLRNGILFEVDYETARRWRTVGRGIEVESIWRAH